MSGLIKNEDIYRVLSTNFKRIIKEEVGLYDVPTSTPGGQGGRLGKVKKGDPTKKIVPSEKPSDEDFRDPQAGKDDPSAATTPGDRPSDVDTSGEKDDLTPSPEETEGPPEGSEKPVPSPEGPEVSDIPGQAGIEAPWLGEDFIIPEGAQGQEISTISTKVETKTGTLTILNLGLSKGSNLLRNPTITYEVILSSNEGEKRTQTAIPYSVVAGAPEGGHFRAVVAFLRNNVDDLGAPAAVAGQAPDIGGPPQ